LSQPVDELVGKLARSGDGFGRASFRRALDRGERADLEPELADLDASLAKADAQLVGEERELVRPDARRDPQEEHAADE
jgi:hypothetical protein